MPEWKRLEKLSNKENLSRARFIIVDTMPSDTRMVLEFWKPISSYDIDPEEFYKDIALLKNF
jgi:hypothetical protein